MNQQQPKVDRPQTQPGEGKGRARGRLATLALLLMVAVVAVAVAATVQAIVRKGSAQPAPHPAAQQPKELSVSDAQADKAAKTNTDSAPDGESDAGDADVAKAEKKTKDADGSDKPSDEKSDTKPGESNTDSEAPADGDATPAEPVTPAHIDLMMIGDILMHSRVIESGNNGDGTYNYDHFFKAIASDIEAADVAVLNQETILGGSGFPYTGYPVFNAPQAVGDAEVAAGFDVVLKATNHTLDYAYDGVHAELAYWASSHPQMAVIGAADPDGDGVCPAGGTSPAGAYVYEKDGLRVALLNYTDVLNGNIDVVHDHDVVSIMTEDRIRADVAAARKKADFVVVFAHWGEEYETVPVASERRWANVMLDAGVDVVIGGHPHVIQPVEVLEDGDRKMLVFWSVGNFVSTQDNASNMVGGMVKVAFERDDTGTYVGDYAFIPTITQREMDRNLCAYKLSDYTDELAARSTAVGGGTRAWYVDYCASVLGGAFDYDTLSVHGRLG